MDEISPNFANFLRRDRGGGGAGRAAARKTFFAPPPPLFALKRKIIKMKKGLKQVFPVYIPLYSLYFL